MKKKDQGNKWLIPTHSNSSESHAVQRVNRFAKPQQPPVPEETLPSPQNQPVQPQTPPRIDSTQSHAVVRRRGPAPVISPAPELQRGGNSGVPAPDPMPPGAASAVSYAPPRLSRIARQQQPPEIKPTSAVSEVLRRSKEPERVSLNPVNQSESRPVSRIRPAHIQPVQMPQPSATVKRAREIPAENLAETKYTPPKPEMAEMPAEMPSVGATEQDESANPFAGRWNSSED